eukprot:CAMPEP_0197178346 /NCGR_PEP_ID=MMETSP1423-20130617/3650_1 /TAXON_ID=476441 /ORGANISM="Pseudo-nitzschia heimii, Strain UNC1101" /LENGTH=463 /DNA_ID=CAMNT_0042628057 /DNA_START=153 /DNA_END=1543 /DNA_ORIENTATION=-
MIFRFAAIQATLASAAVMVAAATTIAESSVIVSAGDERDVVVAASTSFVPRKLEAMRDEPSSSDPVIGRTALRSLESATMTTKRLRNGDVPGPHRAEGGDFDEAAELGLLNQRDANHRGERGLAVGDCESNPTVSADAVFHGLVTACLGLEGVPERDASAVPDGDGSCPYPGVPLGCWDTSEVTNMDEAFLYAADFDGDIDSWDTSSVTSMARTFKGASSFNSPIDSWDVTNVESFASTFENAKAFDQNVDDWDVRSATTFERMFYGADEFFQCISSFHVESGYNLDPDAVDVTDMFKDSGVPVPGDAPGRTVVPSAEQRLLLDQQRPDGHPVPVPDPNAEPGRFGRADGGGIGGADPSAVRQRRGGLRGPLAASRKRPRKEVQQGPDPRRRLLCGDLQERREQPLPVRRQQPSLHPEAPGQGRHHVRRGRGLPRPEAGPAVRQVTGPSELSRDVRRNLPPVK